MPGSLELIFGAKIASKKDYHAIICLGSVIKGETINFVNFLLNKDYGYVGSGRGKITLYKGQEVVKRGVPSENAVDELIEIIREDGNWLEPESVEI